MRYASVAASRFEDRLLARLFRRRSSAAFPLFAGPAGERLYAVGDIHGRLDLLDALLGRIAEDLAARPVDGAALAFLGDFIDRGPESAGVIDRLVDLARSPVRTHFLMGNHEEMLLRVLSGQPGIVHKWLSFGGDACVESYGLSPARLDLLDEEEIVPLLREAVPDAHLAFLHDLEETARFGDFLLVHAGIRPGIAIEDQVPDDLRWIRQPFLADRRDHGVMVIHGHTISDGVDRRVNRIGVDTGAYRTGILTAAAIEESDVRFLDTGCKPATDVDPVRG